jgi:YfiH family protein
MAFELDGTGVLRWSGWKDLHWLAHGFATRIAGDFQRPEPANTTALFGAAEMELRTLRQVHSDIVRPVGEASDDAEGDGLVSDAVGQLLGTRTADCLPLLLLDRERRAVAAVHAGWRGSAAEIGVRAVERMVADFGSRPAQIEALIGPCIGSDRYEVGPEVAKQFPAEAIREIAGRPRPFLDLATANRLQMEGVGVPASQIHVAGICTYSRADWFHSYRRDADQSGRMLAVIGLRDNR